MEDVFDHEMLETFAPHFGVKKKKWCLSLSMSEHSLYLSDVSEQRNKDKIPLLFVVLFIYLLSWLFNTDCFFFWLLLFLSSLAFLPSHFVAVSFYACSWLVFWFIFPLRCSHPFILFPRYLFFFSFPYSWSYIFIDSFFLVIIWFSSLSILFFIVFLSFFPHLSLSTHTSTHEHKLTLNQP